ncbi:MAG: purine-nucleoside phosphorylase [Myxococcales bacterium]
MDLADLARAEAFVRPQLESTPDVALVLGSGLGSLVDAFEDARRLPYATIPGMAETGVMGHKGQLVFGSLEGVPAMAMQGRLHPYEGHPLETVVLGVRLMLRLGARTLIVSNAAGGLDPTLEPGSLLVIDDHLNLTGRNCLVGPNPSELGPRFPDMSEVYDRELIALSHEVARAQGHALAQGIYAGVLGPSYETPAEVRMLRLLGASAVGMSTVQEVIAARHMGARILGLSCITNLASGLSPTPLTHAEVEHTARAAAGRFTQLVRGIVARLRR